MMAHAVQVFAFLLGLVSLAPVRANFYSSCNRPASPNYGGYYGGYRQSYSVGSVVNYYCDHGYTMYGRPWTVCINGNRGPYWLYPAPSCRRKVGCGNLDNPDNGRVRLTGTSVGSRAEYICNGGFILVGDRVRQCLGNGQWSGQAPICRALQCDRLEDIRNGRVSLTGTTVGSTATYSCDRGYILVGDATRTCQANAEWTGREPFCRPVQCDRLSDIRNGRVSLTGTTVGSTATYSCDRGYILVGDATRTCQANAEWTGREPFCRPVQCDRLSDIRNGRVSLTGTTVGSTATYSCDRGYILVGDATRTCQANAEWTGREPFCRLITCDRLQDIRNGKVVLSGTSVGSTASYSCNVGYVLVGGSTRVCQLNGEWTGEEPSCKLVECERLTDIRNGRVSLTGTTVGSTASYSCNRGYILIGDETRTCQANGDWTGREPFCRLITCDRLQDIRNGKVVLSGTSVGSTASYSCNVGYVLVGGSTRVCQLNGEWTGEEPSCKLVECERLTDIRNGRVSLTGTTVGSTASYSCNRGYILIGDETRTCQANGDWTGREPFCQLIECERLQDIKNGKVVLSGTTVGSTATYNCRFGYALIGGSTRTCQINGEWSGEEPFCQLIQCETLTDIRNGRVSLTGTTVGSTATYSCTKGYILVGDSIRVCQSGGEWSGNEPFCRLIECDRLSDIRNGRVSLTGTTVGSTATYSCDRGYILVGDRTRTCQANAEWTGREPFCQLIECDRLRDIRNGKVSLTGTTFGSTATYSCNKGYSLVGDVTRTCQANGEWTGKEPFCQIISCGSLADPRSGRVVLTGTVFGSTATYSCFKGYVLVGGQTRTCQTNGEWSGEAPVCRIVDCGSLADPAFGRVVLTGTTFGSTATYSCQNGYFLVGESTRTCQGNAQWSGVAPVCKVVDCGSLANPNFGRVVLTGTTFGSTATYSCQKGYVLVGSSTRQCEANGQWSGQAPICIRVDCGSLDNPEFGRVVLTGTVFGSTATYSCFKGYVLVGEQTRTCQINGEWSGEAPVCRIVECGQLQDPEFGEVELTGTTFGSTATYSCRKGYFLFGQSTRTCQFNGQWSGTAPVCKIVDCGNLPNPRYGEVALTGTTFGSTATYSCNSGFILVGESNRFCQADGEWSGQEPICQPIECDRLPDIRNGRVLLSGTRVGSTATYSCNSGYRLVGDNTRTCQANGEWTGREPFCKLLECDQLQDIDNGRVSLTGTTVGSRATYSCNQGYILVGDVTRTCLTNEEWSGSEPFCKIVDCGSLANPKFGRVVLTGTTFGSTATYSCQKGYELVGSSTRRCEANGRWSGVAPVCKIVDCGRLADPAFGRVVLTGSTFGSTATYSCFKGYVLVGEQTRTCQANGEWSGEAPVCRIVDCGSLASPKFGQVVISGTTFGSTATYSCQKGYILVGDSTRVCQVNGQWSGDAPTCKIVSCGQLQSPQYGSVSLTGTTVGSTAVYSCNDGFELVGDSRRTCQPDGQWSGAAPICRAVDCGFLRNPRFGKVVLSGTTAGSTATYRCFKGYVLVGDYTRTCQDNAQWSGTAPSCKLVDCGLNLKAPKNGFAHVPCTTLDCIATFWCRSGYTLEGDRSRTCQANGYWSHETPVCLRDYYN